MPFEIPESWVWVTLSEVCEVARGGSPRPIKDYLTTNEDGVNWIKIGDTDKDGKYINSTKEKIIPEGIHRSRFVHKGDFLLTNSMSFGRPYILNIDGCIHDGWLVISPFANTYVTEFLYFLLSSSFAYDQFADAASGGVVSNLNSDKVANSYFPLPPEREQRRIINELNNWFKVVGELDKNIQGVKSFVSRIKSKILDFAISGKLVPQDPNDEPAIELLKRINPGFQPCDNSHYENLPQGWAVCRLSDMVRIQNGFAFQSAKYIDVGIRIIRITNVQSGYIIDESPKFYPHNLMEGLDEYNLKNGDLLMSLTGNVGRVGIMPENLLPAALNQRVCCLKPKNNDIDKMYLFYYFQAEQFIQDCIASGKGVAQLNVSTEWLKHYIIQLPPKEEQSKIVKTIDALFSIIDKITAEL